ncbi:MAG: glycine betaine ABC transporter substrate-binding protein [Lentisphaeria bacterium]
MKHILNRRALTLTINTVLVTLGLFALAGCGQKDSGELTFAVGVEFYERPDGFKKLLETYNFQPRPDNIKKMSIGLTYKALKNEQVDVAMGFATDGRIEAFGFMSLKDDKQFFSVYNPAPVIRTEVLNQHPDIRDTLAPLAKKLNTTTMRQLNKRVDVDHENTKKVAVDWLREQTLLDSQEATTDDNASTAGDRPEITVGGKNFTEQYLLSEMAAALLRQAGYRVKLQTGVGSVIARKSLLNDQVDLYYEYTGTAYTVFHEQSDPEIMRDPGKVYQWVKEKDAEKGVTWLERVDFNNTYTLIMRQDHAQKLGITSISDLARYVTKFKQDEK